MNIELVRADEDSMCANIVFRVYDGSEVIDRICLAWHTVEEELRERHGDELVDLWDECCFDKSKLDTLDPVTFQLVKSLDEEHDRIAQEIAEYCIEEDAA